MRISTIFLLLFLINMTMAAPYAKVKNYTLPEAIAQEIVSLEKVEYLGNKELQLNIKNLHKRKDVRIVFEAGLQFASRDMSEQDQVILQERTLLVKAQKMIAPKFVTYCTQANKRGAGEGSLFDIKTKADGKLLQLCQYLSKIKDSQYTAQHAVWTITDDHDLKGLWHEDMMTGIKIRNFVAKLTAKPLPKYTVKYKDGGERQVAFTGEAILIVGNHEYDLKEDGVLTCQIFNEQGEMVQTVFKDMPQKKGHIKFQFKLKALDLPKGKYVSKVFKGEEVFQESWVES